MDMTWRIVNAMMAHCGGFGVNILICAGSPLSSFYLPATLSAASALSCKLFSKCYPIPMNLYLINCCIHLLTQPESTWALLLNQPTGLGYFNELWCLFCSLHLILPQDVGGDDMYVNAIPQDPTAHGTDKVKPCATHFCVCFLATPIEFLLLKWSVVRPVIDISYTHSLISKK